MRVLMIAAIWLALSGPAFSQGPSNARPAIPSDIAILPEIATPVEMSSTDVNRVVCASVIDDVVFSKEKGLSVHYTKRDAFLKFQVIKENGQFLYATAPVELYVVCGEKVYRLIAVPKRVPSQTVRLIAGPSDRLKSNIALLSGLPFEEKVLTLIKSVYTESIPESFTVTPSHEAVDLFSQVEVTLTRTIVADGEGFFVKEFEVRPKGAHVDLTEKDFLKAELALRPVAVTIDRMSLNPGQSARLLIVERGGEHE